MGLRHVFIKNLRNYRKTRGFSQMKLAELCDSSTSYIGQIEIGNKFPSIEMIEKMAAALNVQPHLLFFDPAAPGGDEEPPTQRGYAMPEAVKRELLKLTGAIRQLVKSQ
jgi:transcriptional regulator with XRE-family HTH domain